MLNTIATYNIGYKHVMCVFQKCSNKIVSTKMCVEIETYTICYMHEMCVFREFSGKGKNLSPKICVEIVLKIY